MQTGLGYVSPAPPLYRNTEQDSCSKTLGARRFLSPPGKKLPQPFPDAAPELVATQRFATSSWRTTSGVFEHGKNNKKILC